MLVAVESRRLLAPNSRPNVTKQKTELSRRQFALASAGVGALAAAAESACAAAKRKRYAIVGVGSRSYLYQEALHTTYAESSELVAICDTNAGRAELASDFAKQNKRKPPKLYAAADYQLVAVRDLPELWGVVPVELQAAFACAAPVVACAGGDTAAIVERARAGLSCPPEDWTSLADRFWLAATIPADARTEMGRRGWQAYRRHMSLRAGVDRIEQLLYDVAAGRVDAKNGSLS